MKRVKGTVEYTKLDQKSQAALLLLYHHPLMFTATWTVMVVAGQCSNEE